MVIPDLISDVLHATFSQGVAEKQNTYSHNVDSPSYETSHNIIRTYTCGSHVINMTVIKMIDRLM